MKKQHKLAVIHNREHGELGGWVGVIPDEETYEKLKAGEVDWKAEHKPRMKEIKIPTELFFRLMVMDNDDSLLQALITYVDEAFKRQSQDGPWITEQGEEILMSVDDAQQWWDTCMKPELVRALVVDPNAK